MLAKLYEYNQWAWGEVLAKLEQLDDAIYKAEGNYFWGSLHGLAVHGLAAETIWLKRLQGVNPDTLLSPDNYPDVASIRAQWQGVSAELGQFYARIKEDSAETMTYTSTEGDQFTVNVADLLHHIILHGAEHRSQITPVLYNEGVATDPMDFIYYCHRMQADAD